MVISVNLPEESYDIKIEKGILKRIETECNLDRRVMVVTDDGVPKEYADTVASRCKEGMVVTIPMGEESKSLETFGQLQQALLDNGFTRKDCVVAVGGGVVGDLSGFAAACYMRGIDFYNVPTTVLSQVDSSIGGKTAINFGGVKNIVGAFYQPKKVIIDPETLNSLSPRQISNGLAEAVKMSLTSDRDLFEKIEASADNLDLTQTIAGAIRIKKYVVEKDVKEADLRKVLNFGHTLGHGIEVSSDGRLYHGESVALGMLTMCSEEVRNRLIPIMKALNLPTSCRVDPKRVLTAVAHDKKAAEGGISAVYVPSVGSFEFRKMTLEELGKRLEQVVTGEEK